MRIVPVNFNKEHKAMLAKQPERLAHLVYFDASLPMEGENEIALWPSNQKENYLADIASGATSRPPTPETNDYLEEI
jgi:hypothetical protein